MKKMVLLSVLLLAGCIRLPAGVLPVENFQLERYLGKWYEIARLDHSFERGLTRVSAEYRLRPDGGVLVLNRGYSAAEGRWKEAEGKAYFVNRADQGFLKVSFFGPFYGAYGILALDQENYSWALVCGPNRSYLWILARRSVLDEAVLRRLTGQARAAGFATEKLIFVRHDAQ